MANEKKLLQSSNVGKMSVSRSQAMSENMGESHKMSSCGNDLLDSQKGQVVHGLGLIE